MMDWREVSCAQDAAISQKALQFSKSTMRRGFSMSVTSGLSVGPIAGLVGIDGGVVSWVTNLESPDVRAPGRGPRMKKVTTTPELAPSTTESNSEDWFDPIESKTQKELSMCMTRKIIALAGVLLVAGAVTTADAAKKKPVTSENESAREEVSELMKMFHADKNGTVSREEFLANMGQEFDALNTSKTGQLTPSEWSRLPMAMSGTCLKANPPPRCLGLTSQRFNRP
jgi:hypothetical protein